MHRVKQSFYLKVFELFFRASANLPCHRRLEMASPVKTLEELESRMSLKIPGIFKLFMNQRTVFAPAGWELYGFQAEQELLSINSSLRELDGMASSCFVFGKSGDEDFLLFPNLSERESDDCAVVWCDADDIGRAHKLPPFAASFCDLLLGCAEQMAEKQISEFTTIRDEAKSLKRLVQGPAKKSGPSDDA